jgi:hypothetical protein
MLVREPTINLENYLDNSVAVRVAGQVLLTLISDEYPPQPGEPDLGRPQNISRAITSYNFVNAVLDRNGSDEVNQQVCRNEIKDVVDQLPSFLQRCFFEKLGQHLENEIAFPTLSLNRQFLKEHGQVIVLFTLNPENGERKYLSSVGAAEADFIWHLAECESDHPGWWVERAKAWNRFTYTTQTSFSWFTAFNKRFSRETGLAKPLVEVSRDLCRLNPAYLY